MIRSSSTYPERHRPVLFATNLPTRVTAPALGFEIDLWFWARQVLLPSTLLRELGAGVEG